MGLRDIVIKTAAAFSGSVRTYLNNKYGGYVLVYHTISEQKFREHLDALGPDKAVSLTELLERQKAGKPTGGLFAITVDDGYKQTVADMNKVCVEKGIPITHYLPTAYLNKGTLPFLHLLNLQRALPARDWEMDGEKLNFSNADTKNQYFDKLRFEMYGTREAIYVPQLERIAKAAIDQNIVSHDDVYKVVPPMSWQEVESWSKHPEISFESHGVSHQAVSSLTEVELENEFKSSKAEIESHTGKEILHFCYPFGAPVSIGDLAPKVAARFYQSAVIMSRGRINGKDPFRLPRIPIYEKDDGAFAKVKTLCT